MMDSDAKNALKDTTVIPGVVLAAAAWLAPCSATMESAIAMAMDGVLAKYIRIHFISFH